ncbi:hypothetical protein BD311DRAFT_663142 [Dichomitus squalens]|uniref:Zn(2)-C6 fungal-type domain-containing protein n=1 Tax=Dichomitus squalens TaxID=114155 RepID=A0A4Q9MQ81_9APHY|nr:hypothetical protein BD311DRAFT_663142 [Dichomitus squalens]
MVNTSPTSHRSPTSGSATGRSRREKPRLELAADQPLTTQGKPRMRVYVACVQCRGRKIRCDGAKPVCHNCSRRTENPHLCTYDTAPKRRGPDRVPGARQRSAGGIGEKPPRRRRRHQTQDGPDQLFVTSQSASVSPVEAKPTSFSPTGQAFLANTSAPHSDNLTIIQEVGPVHYGRHRQGLPESSRASMPTGVGTHYPQPHNLTQAAAFEAMSLGSPLSDAPVGSVGYPLVAPLHHGLLLRHVTGSDDEFSYGDSGGGDEDCKGVGIARDPGLQFTRETWWDALLLLYASEGGTAPQYGASVTMPPGVRETTTARITADLRFIFRASPHWLHFINLPRFFGSLLDPRARHYIQPGLILGALALAMFFRSHDGEGGLRGRERALTLRDQAQSALEASLNSRWVDHGLVQAAWLLAFFEICAHPLHSTARVRSSMGLLDSLLRSLNLLALDSGNPKASVFSTVVPIISTRSPRQLRPLSPEDSSFPRTSQSPVDSRSLATHGWSPIERQSAAATSSCSCTAFTLGHSWAMVHEIAPLWDMTPTWQSEWTESDIRMEECRRLVWSSVMLSSGHSSYTAARSESDVQQLFMMDPRNYALLFPGESLTCVDGSPDIPPPSKDSVWALYMRAMLLWNSCIRLRTDTSLPDTDKAQFALTAWTEIEAIEEALGRHTCGIERSFLFQGRELLFNSRMVIAYEFQRCLPQPTQHANLLFYRRKAEEWLTRQAILAKRLANADYGSVTGLPTADLTKRPFLLFWFMSLIERALTLWSYDQSLGFALDVAKTLSQPVEYLMTLWPCAEQRRRWEDLQEKLNRSLFAATVPVPPSAVSIPPPGAA